MMKSKTHSIKKLIDEGNIDKALSIAAKFFDKSEDTKLFKEAASAKISPAFYKQIGKNPDEIIDAAKDVLIARFT